MRLGKWILIAAVLLFTPGYYKTDESNAQAIDQSLDTIAEIMTLAGKNAPTPVSSEKLVQGAIDGLLSQLDPHSSFYDNAHYQTMIEDQKGSFCGIGIILGYQNNQLTVISPVEGTPASRAGMRAGDIITRIDTTDTRDLDSTAAIRLLRGEIGSPVRVTVSRPGTDEPIEFNLLRAEIPSNTVRASFMLDERTGYIMLAEFGETAQEEVAKAALDLEKKGMKQLFLDLRGNPGGLLPQAIGVASLFIPGGKTVVSTKGRLSSSNQEYESEKNSPLAQLPLILLIDRGSASAAEIVAGALQDHDRALVLGTNSWGKGLVQSVFTLDDGNKGLALTTARYYTPSGRNIQGNFESLEDYYNPESSEDNYFEPSDEVKKAAFKTLHGREVYEVRGITPDVYIPSPEMPEYMVKLEGKLTNTFNFTILHQEKYGKITPDWLANEAVVNDFRSYLEKNQVDLSGFEANREFIRQRLTVQMLYAYNATWAWRYRTQIDYQVTKGLELFDKAKELLAVYRGDAKLSKEYSQGLKQYARLNRPQ